jgi:ABC-type multidrug transport system fused ATPase/permease subunit
MAAVAGYAGFALFTEIVFHLRIKIAFRFGEKVMSALRREVFTHLMRMSVAFYKKLTAGGIISRLTSDIEAIRAGVQEALFVSIVQGGQIRGWRALHPAVGMPIGDLIMFLFLAHLFNPFRGLSNQYGTALAALAGAERVFKILDTPPMWEDPAGSTDNITGRVEFVVSSSAVNLRNRCFMRFLLSRSPGAQWRLSGTPEAGRRQSSTWWQNSIFPNTEKS